eukprot:g280.t1
MGSGDSEPTSGSNVTFTPKEEWQLISSSTRLDELDTSKLEFGADTKTGDLYARIRPMDDNHVDQLKDKDAQGNTTGLTDMESIPGATISSGRKMILGFTCCVCGQRSTKLISRNSFLRGVVIVKCEGCENLHLIADRLGWFPEDGIQQQSSDEQTNADSPIVTTPESLPNTDKTTLLDNEKGFSVVSEMLAGEDYALQEELDQDENLPDQEGAQKIDPSVLNISPTSTKKTQ